MKRLNALLDAWESRSERHGKGFSDSNREQIAAIFIDVSDACMNGTPTPENAACSAEKLATLALDDGLSMQTAMQESRACQLALLALWLKNQHGQDDGPACLETLDRTNEAIDELLHCSCTQLKARLDSSEQVASDESAGNPPKKARTLQHEIRTPLQGALLTTELMLEDAQQGDTVQSEDILAVRRSIETAVQILNEFASRPSD